MAEPTKPDWWTALGDAGGGQSFEDWEAYDRLLGHLRGRPARVLILGMQPELVAAWIKFLPRARVMRLSTVPAEPDRRLLDFPGAPSNAAALQTVLTAAAGQRFDAVIDDGSHKVEDVWPPFDLLFDRWLESGGVYAMQAWGVSYLDAFSEGARPKLEVRNGAIRLGSKPRSHVHGLAGLIKGLIDHVPWRDVQSGGIPRESMAPIRSVTVLHNVVGMERW